MSASGTELRYLVGPVDTWSPAKEAPDDPFMYVDLSSVDHELKEITSPQGMTGVEAPSRARQILKSRDVLVSTVRPNLNAVAHVPDEVDGATGSTGFCVLRANPEDLDSRYLFHWTRSPAFVASMVRRATGASYPAVSDRIVKESKIPLPPLPEQQRIAAILDKADAVRRKRQQTLDLADQFLRSAFLDMFGDPVTNPKGWPVRKLGQLIVEGPSNGLYKPSSEYGSGIPIVRIDSFSGGDVVDLKNLRRVRLKADDVARFGLRENDILINRVNAPSHLGKSALVPSLHEPTVYESNMMRLRVDSAVIEPQFLVVLLQDRWVKGQILRRSRDAVNQSSINQSDVRSLLVLLPPWDVQNEYRRRAKQVDSIQARARSLQGQVESLCGGLTQRAFRGEL
jgi:type I restriction enzyme, S subunit